MKISAVSANTNMMINPYSRYRRTAAASKPVIGFDKLEISDNAFELYTEKSDIRADKVKEIQNRIAEGSYYVSSADLADSIMRSVFSA